MRQLGVDGDETFTIPPVDSDGCPNQFDLAAQYRRISTQQNKTGIQMDWTLNCSCHAKGPSVHTSDGIGADMKGSINAEQMLDADDRPTRVEDWQASVRCSSAQVSLHAKAYLGAKMACAASRRIAFFVPNHGPDAANHGPDAVRRPVLGRHTLAKCLQSACKHSASACKVPANTL